MRSALFVDFDNVFSGLARLGPAYAEAFARNPTRWMQWLTETVAHPPGVDTDAKRRILVRRCYLNPEPYKRFRIGFSRAGFEIVDCPPMTTAGKTSTDIHMVLDMVDVLQSPTRYDEFIVFSADADFTPVLRKLRREDRRTTIFAAGATSASYDASADLILDPEAFIREGLGLDEDDTAPQAPDLESLVAQAEAVVWRTVDQADRPVPLPALTKALAVNVPALPHTGWAGKGTFLALLKSLPLAPLRIDREQNVLLDPRRLGRPAGEPPAPTPALPKPGAEERQEATAAVIEQLARLIVDEVAASSRPIAVARLAQLARARLPAIEADWLGHGSWKKLLEGVRPPGVQIVWSQLAGYALDPQRHSLDLSAAVPGGDAASDAEPRPPAIAPLLEAAGLPLLPAGRYRLLLQALSQALDVQPFSLAAVTKRMRDDCQDRHAPVSREHCNTLVRSLLFNGFLPDTDAHDLEALATRVCDVVAAAAGREGIRVDDADRVALNEWVMG